MRVVPHLVLLLAVAFLWPGAFMAGAIYFRSWPARGALLLIYLAGVGVLGVLAAPRFDPLLALAAGAPLAAWLLSVHPRLRVTGPAVLFVLLAGAAAFLAVEMSGHQYLVRTGSYRPRRSPITARWCSHARRADRGRAAAVFSPRQRGG
jgi:hypothetical protein